MNKAANTFLHEEGWKRAIPFALLFVYLLIIYQNVHVVWDDYSFASLSLFSNPQPNVNGTNWTLEQLINYCIYIYKNWMGRVLFHVFVNDLLLRNLWVYRFLSAISITVVFYMLYRFAGVPQKPMYAILTCLGYGLFCRRQFTDTFYYFSGVAGYVMPLLFMFGGLFLYRRIFARGWNFKEGIPLLLLSFISALSQEQISSTYCFTLGLMCLYYLFKQHNLKPHQCLLLLICFVGAALLFLAPGNFSRMGIQAVLRQPTYLLQLYKNIAMFCTVIYQKDNIPFLIVLVVTTVHIAYIELFANKIYTNKEVRKKDIALFVCICAWSIAIFVQSTFCRADATVFTWEPVAIQPWDITSVSILYVINTCLYSILVAVLVYRRLMYWNDRFLTAFMFAALLTNMFSFLYSFYVVARMTLTLDLALMMFMLRLFSDVKSKYRLLAFNFVGAISCIWLTVFLCGYSINDPIYTSNEDTFTAIAGRLHAGEPVVLDGLRCDWNRYFTPERVFAHGGNRDILEYYDFPDNVQFIPYPPQLYFSEL